MARIAMIDRADMDAEQARLRRSQGIQRPRGRAVHRLYPVAETVRGLPEPSGLVIGGRCRAASSRSSTWSARHWNARYPWFAQVRASLAVGIDQAVIDAINARKTRSGQGRASGPARSELVVARELLANKGLSDETYAAAEKTMGLEGLVALVATTGSFSMTCLTAATFGIDPPADNPTPLAL